jgi:hypothetical protein
LTQEKKEKKAKKHKKTSSKEAAASAAGPRPAVQLDSENDYFHYSKEFRYWLRTDRKVAFDTLTSRESRKLFKKFCASWNEGRLPEYYSGLPSSALEAATKVTSHAWGFAKKLSSRDQSILESAKDSVHVSTEAAGGGESKKRPAPEAWSAAGKKLQCIEDKGQAQVEAIRRTMGLQPGQRIQIAPRPEGE